KLSEREHTVAEIAELFEDRAVLHPCLGEAREVLFDSLAPTEAVTRDDSRHRREPLQVGGRQRDKALDITTVESIQCPLDRLHVLRRHCLPPLLTEAFRGRPANVAVNLGGEPLDHALRP